MFAMLIGAFVTSSTFPFATQASGNVAFKLPAAAEPYPRPFAKGEKVERFAIRGTKGWGWTPEQYLRTIPVMAKYRMNFLMNCYVSMFTDPEKWVNRWWEPIPEAKKKAYAEVVCSCRKHKIDFCFSMHPQLGSSRPLKFDSDSDFEAFASHYLWMQGLGVRWFSVTLDDIATGDAAMNFGASNHAKLVNRLLAKLREKDPKVRMIFCPTYYWGTGDTPEHRPYLETLSKELDPSVYLFWTGDAVYTAKVTRQAAETYRGIVKHRLILWDNFPVNDRNPAMHLGPLVARDRNLCEVVDGYMGNPMAYESGLNDLPLMTCADYAYHPAAYDPSWSAGQAAMHLGRTPQQRTLMMDLIKLYPGPLVMAMDGGHFIWPVEAVRRAATIEEARGVEAALKSALERLQALYPNEYEAEKAVMKRHVEMVGKEIAAKFGES